MIGSQVVTAVAAGATLLAIVALVVVAQRRSRQELARAEEHVRPILYRALDEGTFDTRTIDALTPVQQRCLEGQARGLLHNLSGRDRDTLARLLDHRGAVEAARQQTRSTRAEQRAEAGNLLADAGSPAAVRDLLKLLHDPDPQVRWAAARGLGRLGHPSALSPLLASLEGPRPMPFDVVADAVFQIRDCPVSLLRQGLKSRSMPTRAVTVELLGRFQALVAAEDITGLLHHDPSVEVRARAARSLGRMGSPRAIPSLLICLNDGPVAVRAMTIWALGEIGGPEARGALRSTLIGPSHQVRGLAAEALAALGPAGIEVLTEIAASDRTGSAAAARALSPRSSLEPAHA